jgi:hypothetical protein
MRSQLPLQLQAFHWPAVDLELYVPGLLRVSDQAMDFSGRDTKLSRDLALRPAADKRQPRSPDGHVRCQIVAAYHHRETRSQELYLKHV